MVPVSRSATSGPRSCSARAAPKWSISPRAPAGRRSSRARSPPISPRSSIGAPRPGRRPARAMDESRVVPALRFTLGGAHLGGAALAAARRRRARRWAPRSPWPRWKAIATYRQIETGAPARRAGLGAARASLSYCSRRAPAAGAQAGRRRRGGAAGELRPADRLRPQRRGGRARQTFDELLADLREKRDMEEYVTELSRNLPEAPRPRRVLRARRRAGTCCCSPSSCAATPAPAAAPTPQDAGRAEPPTSSRIATAIARGRGQVEAIAGHRVLARFEGESRGHRALSAAARILEGYSPPADRSEQRRRRDEAEAPVVALAAGRAITGPVTWGRAARSGRSSGLPVQQIESLLREATPGEILMSARCTRS